MIETNLYSFFTIFLFYFFSLILSYNDCTKYKVPNNIVIIFISSLLLLKIIAFKLTFSLFILPFIILILFILILLIFPKYILGGGDIKYFIIISFYLNDPLIFSYFLIISGILQSFWIFYRQKYKKRRVAPMIPILLFSVFLIDLFLLFGF
jgi:Flp pilus assembly protein protease CpaA